VLLLGPERACRRVGGALLLLGYRGIPVSDAPSALRALAGAGAVISGLVSGELPNPAPMLEELHASLATPLVWTLWGVRPEAASAAALRAAHVRFLLTDPFTEEDLRFVLDTSHQLGDYSAPRIEPRVPTTLRARVITKTGERVAVVCNISKQGAYLATPRPALRGGRIELEIPLPGHAIHTEADVLWNNVPGNLRRPNAPVGMGVRFTSLAAESVAALGAYLEERAAAYRL
jgi:hypothetical protein